MLSKRFPVFAAVLALLAGPPAGAQMVTGAGMTDFAATFALRPAADVSVAELGCTCPANVLWPKEQATFTFRVQNKSGEALKLPAKVDVVHYGTKGAPGDVWKPIVFKIGDEGSAAVALDVPARGEATFQVSPKIPETFGGYALVLDLGARGRLFAASLVRVPKAAPGRVWQPTYALDLPWPFEMSEEVFRLFKRLGVKGARVEGGYNTIQDAHIPWAMANDVTLMLTVGAGNTPREQEPLGRGRPFLTPDGKCIEKIKEDLAWQPSFDDEFQRYITGVLVQYGWPKGPINAVELWNEPWEGVSISGWGADMLRYREIYTHLAHAVMDARRQAGVKVLIGGACSSTNTRDKLFCDGTNTFLPWLDFVSIHYQPLAADPALERDWMTRKGEFGRVRVWDTESWVANSEDRVGAVIATMRAMGQDRTAGIYRGNVYEPQKVRVDGKEVGVVQAWSPAAAVAATQSFIGQRPFKEILFKNGLPWVLLFDGLPDDKGVVKNHDDGTAVIVGDLGGCYDKRRSLFRSVALAKDAQIEFPDGGGAFRLFDFYGNPLPARAGKIVVPLNGLGYFVRTNGRPGTFARLQKAIAGARIRGIEPVEILAGDLTAPVETHPRLKLRLTNVLNRPVAGTLRATMQGLTLSPAGQRVSLKPGESKEVFFAVSAGQASPENAYALSATFDAGKDGQVKHQELMHVNAIAHRTITVDGNLDDWKGVLPESVGEANRVGTSLTEQAYLPFKSFDNTPGTGTATGYLAYDDRYLYFAATVPAMDGMVRFETRNDDDYFYPEKVLSNGKELTWPAGVRRYSYRKNPDLPSGNGGHNLQIAFNAIPPERKAMLTHPAGTMPRFMCYQDSDYEFALNKVGEQYGGGTEIFCLAKPGAPRKHFYPRQPKAPVDGGPVKGDAKLVVNGTTIECALPWSVIPEVKQRLDAGQTVKFSYRVNDGGGAYELAANRSVSKDNPMAFHNDWATHWANELEFGWEK